MDKLKEFFSKNPLYIFMMVVCVGCLLTAANGHRWQRDLESELRLENDQGQIVSYRCGVTRQHSPVLALRLESYRQQREFYSSGILECDRVGEWWQEAWAEIRYDRAGQLWSLMVEGHTLFSVEQINEKMNKALTGYRRMLLLFAAVMAFFVWQSYHRYCDPHPRL